MKFYKRFPGDITIKTGHLTPAEFGCYDRLLDHYYATEAPIPQSGAYSICRAVTPADRKACDKVLAEFFALTGEGWMQQRADEEIADALPRIQAARENGKKGGRPPKQKPTGFSDGTQDESQTGDSAQASQIPESSLRSDISKASPSHPPRGGNAAARFAEFWEAWPKGERKQDKAKCLAKWKRCQLDAKADQILADVRRKRATTKWQEGYIEAPLVYLNGERWEDGVEPDSEGGNEIGGKPWYETRSGIEAKGEALGLGRWDEAEWARGGESFQRYTARVFKAAGLEPARVPAGA